MVLVAGFFASNLLFGERLKSGESVSQSAKNTVQLQGPDYKPEAPGMLVTSCDGE
ncbi:MAG: hypothetical protein ACK2TW_04115 [Anaerolineales bacterium]